MSGSIQHAPRPAGGFTLLELLVAVAIFSIMTALAWPGLSGLLASRARVDEQQRAFAVVLRGVTTIENDVRHAAPRPVRDEFGDQVAAVRGGVDSVLLELTRRLPPVDGFDRVSGLARIDYVFDAGRVMRREWEVLDRTQATRYSERVLFEGVHGIDIEFLDDERWWPYWPRAEGRVAADRLPAAVSVEFEFTDGRSLRRVLALAEAARDV